MEEKRAVGNFAYPSNAHGLTIYVFRSRYFWFCNITFLITMSVFIISSNPIDHNRNVANKELEPVSFIEV